MMATNHDYQLDEIYPMMLNQFNCTFGINFSRFHCCGRHGHGLWLSWYHGIGPLELEPLRIVEVLFLQAKYTGHQYQST